MEERLRTSRSLHGRSSPALGWFNGTPRKCGAGPSRSTQESSSCLNASYRRGGGLVNVNFKTRRYCRAVLPVVREVCGPLSRPGPERPGAAACGAHPPRPYETVSSIGRPPAGAAVTASAIGRRRSHAQRGAGSAPVPAMAAGAAPRPPVRAGPQAPG